MQILLNTLFTLLLFLIFSKSKTYIFKNKEKAKQKLTIQNRNLLAAEIIADISAIVVAAVLALTITDFNAHLSNKNKIISLLGYELNNNNHALFLIEDIQDNIESANAETFVYNILSAINGPTNSHFIGNELILSVCAPVGYYNLCSSTAQLDTSLSVLNEYKEANDYSQLNLLTTSTAIENLIYYYDVVIDKNIKYLTNPFYTEKKLLKDLFQYKDILLTNLTEDHTAIMEQYKWKKKYVLLHNPFR